MSDVPESRGSIEARLQVRQENLFAFLLACAGSLIIPVGRLMHFFGIAVVVLDLRMIAPGLMVSMHHMHPANIIITTIMATIRPVTISPR